MPDETGRPEGPKKPDEPIDVEPSSETSPRGAGRGPAPGGAEPSDGGYAVDEPPPGAARPKRGLGDEVCPNCGAPRTERDALLCLRCGFDLKTLTVVKTATGTTEETEDEPGEARRLSRAGRGGAKLPLVMAVVAGVLLLIGFLAGSPGLLPGVETVTLEDGGVTIPFAARLFGVLKCAVLCTVLISCGLLGLLLLAHLLDARAGDLRLAATRLLGVVVTMRLVTWIDLPNRGLEWTLEAVLQIAVFYGLTTFLFELSPRESATYGLATLMSFIALWLLSLAVAWVTLFPGG